MIDNHIKIGDKIIVGGLFSDDFLGLNNKIGTIKKIMFASSGYYSTYLVDVNIDGNIVPINLSYIFKLDDLDIFNYYELTEFTNPIDFYISKCRLVGHTYMLIDQRGTSYLQCKTRENNLLQLTLSNLN